MSGENGGYFTCTSCVSSESSNQMFCKLALTRLGRRQIIPNSSNILLSCKLKLLITA